MSYGLAHPFPVEVFIMKIKISIFKHFGRLRLTLSNFNGMLGLKSRPRLIGTFLRISKLCLVRLRKGKIAGTVLLISRIIYLYRTQGPKGLTVYLKGCTVLLQQALGGYKVDDPSRVAGPGISRNGSGFPRIIPKVLRRHLTSDYALIKFVFTILNMYRVIEYKGVVKLSTITNPFIGYVEIKGPVGPNQFVADMPITDQETAIRFILPYIPAFIESLVKLTKIRVSSFTEVQWNKLSGTLFIIWKAAPGMVKLIGEGGISDYSTHPVNLVFQLRKLAQDKEIFESFLDIVKGFGHYHLSKLVSAALSVKLLDGPSKSSIGKLHAKEEAAGKVRIFAIVDAWTQ